MNFPRRHTPHCNHKHLQDVLTASTIPTLSKIRSKLLIQESFLSPEKPEKGHILGESCPPRRFMPSSSFSRIHFLSKPLSRLRRALRRSQTPPENHMDRPSPREKNARLPLPYPQTRRTDQVDTYQNRDGEVKIPDPYNWIEQEPYERISWLDSTF